jgi:uncharacterized membrane protein
MTGKPPRTSMRREDPVDDARFRVGPRWLGLYANAEDARLFVPKPGRWLRLGRTLNLAHPHARWFIGAIAFLLLFGITLSLARP